MMLLFSLCFVYLYLNTILPFERSYGLISTFTLSPGKLGEMVRARYYQSHGIPVSAVSGAFFVERLLDLAVMILLAVAVLAELQAYRAFLWVAVGLVGALLASVALVPWTRVAAHLMAVHQGKLVVALRPVVNMLVSARQFLAPGLLLSGLLMGLVLLACDLLMGLLLYRCW